MQVYWELLRLFIGTETLSSPAYLNIPDPCRSKRELIPPGINYPLDPQYAQPSGGIKERINISHKTMKAQKISSQSLLKVIATFLTKHLATCGHCKPRHCFIALYIILCHHQ